MFEISDIFKIVYYYIYIFVQKVMLVLGERNLFITKHLFYIIVNNLQTYYDLLFKFNEVKEIH